MWLALVGIAGIILGALMTSLFNHWAWLQARRLDEYAALVTAFLASASASAAAAQGRTIYDPDAPAERAELSKLVQDAWRRGDDHFAALNRVKVVGSARATEAADSMTAFVGMTPRGAAIGQRHPDPGRGFPHGQQACAPARRGLRRRRPERCRQHQRSVAALALTPSAAHLDLRACRPSRTQP